MLPKKFKSEEIVVTKADKGSSVVLMKKVEYEQKMSLCLESMSAEIDTTFNFDKYNDEIRGAIN